MSIDEIVGPHTPNDTDYRLDLVVEVSLDNGLTSLPVMVALQPGSQGNTEAQLDEAIQALADHLATLPSLLGEVTGTKITRTAYTVTPTEE